MTHSISADGQAAVAVDYYWQPMSTAPRGVKLQLLGTGGAAVYGHYDGRDDFWVGWAPCPKVWRGEA